jgi:hypothetical protein
MLITPTAASIGRTPVGLLLQGDARYESIPLDWKGVELVGMVVSHHGGEMGGVPPAAPSLISGGRAVSHVVCSVGCANNDGEKPYGHPHPVALTAHTSAGWAVNTFTYQRKVPRTCPKNLGNYYLSLDNARPGCGCDCASTGHLSLNSI